MYYLISIFFSELMKILHMIFSFTKNNPFNSRCLCTDTIRKRNYMARNGNKK